MHVLRTYSVLIAFYPHAIAAISFDQIDRSVRSRLDQSGTCLAVSILASEFNVNMAFGAQTQELLISRLYFTAAGVSCARLFFMHTDAEQQ